jgi:predicted transcriptional regulator
MKQEIERAILRCYSTLSREITSDEDRLSILYELSKGERSHGELRTKLSISEKKLHSQLAYLRKIGLIEGDERAIRLTDAGRGIIGLSLEEMMKIARFADELVTGKLMKELSK